MGPGSNPNVLSIKYWVPIEKARLLSGTHLDMCRTEENHYFALSLLHA